jgi:hypothetical protein
MGSRSCLGNNQASYLQEVPMKEKDVEELAESVGKLVEKILRLALSKNNNGHKNDKKG